MPKKPAVILVPCRGPILPQCERGLDALAVRGYEVRKVWGHTAIDYGRSRMASDALKDGFATLFWIDSDVAFNPDDVDNLIDSGNPFCCGIYPKKNGKEIAASFTGVQEGDQIHFGCNGGWREADTIGFGFVCTYSCVYRAMLDRCRLPECNGQFGPPMIPYFLPEIIDTPKGKWYLPDDYAFCWRARQCGYKIMADTRIPLAHVGSYEYTMHDVQRNGLANAPPAASQPKLQPHAA